MRIGHQPVMAAVILLAGMAASYGLLGSRHAAVPATALAPVRQSLPAPGTQARSALDWCHENVAIIHDLYWATACAAAADVGEAEDSTECTLPYERARPLNAARERAEQQCLDEALAGSGSAPAAAARK